MKDYVRKEEIKHVKFDNFECYMTDNAYRKFHSLLSGYDIQKYEMLKSALKSDSNSGMKIYTLADINYFFDRRI